MGCDVRPRRRGCVPICSTGNNVVLRQARAPPALSVSHLTDPLELLEALANGRAVRQRVVALEDRGDVLRPAHRLQDA